MANRVGPLDIIKMNELYLTIKTYAGVAREVGFSASTVKRYIDPNFKLVPKVPKSHFMGGWGDMDIILSEFKKASCINDFIKPTKEELKDIEDLKGEI